MFIEYNNMILLIQFIHWLLIFIFIKLWCVCLNTI